MSAIRDNWRIALLVVAIGISLFLLFGGGGGGAATPDGANATGPAASESGLTALKYGLELSGGTRIQAPLIGTTAENVDPGDRNASVVEQAVAEEFPNVSVRDVALVTQERRGSRTVSLEVRANVSTAAVKNTVTGENLQTADTEVRQGVTSETRNEVQTVLQDKIDETGVQGGRVRMSFFRGEGRWFAIVEVPNANTSEVASLIEDRGSVRVYAYHEQNGSFQNRTALTNDDFGGIEPPELTDRGPRVPVTVGAGAAEQFQRDMVETGIARSGGSGCGFPGGGSCMLITRDGEIVGQFGMEPRLASSMIEGSWANEPAFVLPTENFSQARELSINLRAGELPTGLDLAAGTGTFISPSFGESARLDSIITALFAVLGVTAVVVVRYGDVRVAIPMVVTALSEVLLLLGFASGVGLALDLSHIAGFIAVIGTGVDDLVIIADDILQQGSVATDRVFKSRFRKALWVIGVAAATTIIAMLPLAVLGLQQLRGFAIVTIVGVLLGVLVTRPAYGDILRYLVMDSNRD
jgi:preprotein translocase subunit SecD